MRFAASYGLDTRLGIACLDLCDGNMALDMKKLGLAAMACAPEKHDRFCHEARRVSETLVLTDERLSLIRACADQGHRTPPRDQQASTRYSADAGPPSCANASLRACLGQDAA